MRSGILPEDPSGTLLTAYFIYHISGTTPCPRGRLEGAEQKCEPHPGSHGLVPGLQPHPDSIPAMSSWSAEPPTVEVDDEIDHPRRTLLTIYSLYSPYRVEVAHM
jgi:hypothetical protein